MLCGFAAWFFWQRSKHKERLMMIEKGIHPDAGKDAPNTGRKTLAIVGTVVMGLGIGLAIISLLVAFDSSGLVNKGPTSVAILVICGAGSLLYANRRNG